MCSKEPGHLAELKPRKPDNLTEAQWRVVQFFLLLQEIGEGQDSNGEQVLEPVVRRYRRRSRSEEQARIRPTLPGDQGGSNGH